MPTTRQLAAIVFTDIEGYSAIMQQNEEKAIILRDRHREILQKEHRAFNGRIVQYYGDGTLSIFQSAVEAVYCALAMQKEFRKSPEVPVRMGLHIGDVIVTDEQVLGDGVNISARIESLGVAGAVLMSDKVKDEISNHPQLKTRSVGNYQFKNIQRIVEVFALDHEDLVIPLAGSLQGKTASKSDETQKTSGEMLRKSIAVMAFLNMSNDAEQEYFSDGIAEEIINSLSHLKELRVSGRMSSFQFKYGKYNLQEVGKKLGVTSILQGSVRKQGNKIRISAQLVNAEDGFQLWSEKYDRTIDDIFQIQDDIAKAVTHKLKVTLLKKSQPNKLRYVPKMEAYELLLKGRFYLSRRGAGIKTALTYFKQSIEADPLFALAHAAYADANILLATYGLLPPAEVMLQAKKSAARAIQLNPLLPEPYCSLGYYYNYLEWNWPEAKKNFLRSIELNPEYAEAHYRFGQNYLVCVEGKFQEALHHTDQAIKIEPLSSVCYGSHSIVLYTAGLFREAFDACKVGIDLDSNSFLCHLNAGCSLLALKEYKEATSFFETALRISNRHHFAVNGLIWTYCLTGQHDIAKTLMHELAARSQHEYIAKTFTALSAAYLNDVELAFEYLQAAYHDHDPILLLLKYADWVPDCLRNDQRFSKLIDRIGLPERVSE